MRGIITADWHVRAQRPRCRRDEDWLKTQRDCIHKIILEANCRKSSLYIVGDIFHTSRPPAEIINMVLDELLQVDDHVFIIPGNHDLAYHSHEQESKSGYGILRRYFVQLRMESPFIHFEGDHYFIHQLTFPDEKSRPIPGAGQTAEGLMKKFPNKWIFTGDYHRAFYVKNGDRSRVVNPGCINIQTADMIDYTPGFYFVDTDADDVEFIELADDKTSLSDEYTHTESERNERIDAFVSAIKEKGEVGLDFIENLKQRIAGLKSHTREVIDEILSELEE